MSSEKLTFVKVSGVLLMSTRDAIFFRREGDEHPEWIPRTLIDSCTDAKIASLARDSEIMVGILDWKARDLNWVPK